VRQTGGRLFFAKLSFEPALSLPKGSKESGNDFILCKWFELIAFRVKRFGRMCYFEKIRNQNKNSFRHFMNLTAA